MQLQADLLQCPLATSSNHEVSAQGAAFMAGIKAGLWSTDDIERIHEASLEKFYQPTGSLEDLEEFIAGWHEAVRRSLQWANKFYSMEGKDGNRKTTFAVIVGNRDFSLVSSV